MADEYAGADHEAAFDFRLYRYTPSLPAAIVSAAVFGILTTFHTWRLWRARAFYFTAFTIGGLCELHTYTNLGGRRRIADLPSPVQTIGYCGRIWSHYDTESIGGFIMQAILILVAPALYAASIYMILGRLIRKLGAEHLSLIPIKWLTKVFVTGDVISFTLQAGGGGVQSAGTLELYEMGDNIIIAGLFVQICVFGIFVVTTFLFHRRISAKPTSMAQYGRVPWTRHIWVLYATSAIILVRSIFRVIEYLQGNGGYLISHEIFLYIFDTILMVAVMLMFLVWYIDDLSPSSGHRKVNSHGTESNVIMLEEIPRKVMFSA